MKYEIFEHTADIGVTIFGKSYDEIFNNSVVAFADLIVDISKLSNRHRKDISMKSSNPEFLLVDLLSMVLYEFEANGILYFNSELEFDPAKCSLNGRIMGDDVSENVDYRNVIKAVTYHRVEIDPKKGYAKVVFDI